MPNAEVARITRRDGLRLALLAAPAVLVAACSSDDAAPAPSTSAPAPAADVSARDESLLIAEYDAVLGAFPDLPAETTALLTAIRGQHVEHRDALGGAPDAEAVTAPATAEAALGRLLTVEREAARSRVTACVDAQDPQAARLLAFIGASEAAHVPALKDVRT